MLLLGRKTKELRENDLFRYHRRQDEHRRTSLLMERNGVVFFHEFTSNFLFLREFSKFFD